MRFPDNCPYPGVLPFTRETTPWYHGRHGDVIAINAALVSRPLTVLYGPSGVGKSSLLCARMIDELSQVPGGCAVYHRDWAAPDFARSLNRNIADTVTRIPGKLAPTDTSRPLDDYLRELNSQRLSLFLLLDQFEEHLLIAPTSRERKDFNETLCKAIHDDSISANFLIGIREDCLAELSVLEPDLPSVFERMIRLHLLNHDQARLAIELPAKTRRLPCLYETEAVTRLLEGCGASGDVDPLLLQISLWRLWQEHVFDRPEQQNIRIAGHQLDVAALLESFVFDTLSSICTMPVVEPILEHLERLVADHPFARSVPIPDDVATPLLDSKLVRRVTEGVYRISSDRLTEPAHNWCRQRRAAILAQAEQQVLGRRQFEELSYEMLYSQARPYLLERMARQENSSEKRFLFLCHARKTAAAIQDPQFVEEIERQLSAHTPGFLSTPDLDGELLKKFRLSALSPVDLHLQAPLKTAEIPATDLTIETPSWSQPHVETAL